MAYLIRTKDGKAVEVRGHKVLGQDNTDFEFKDFNDSERSFVAVANAESIDRIGDIIMQDGWDLKNYRKNPVVMPFHNYSKLPVGRSLEEWFDTKKNIKRLMFRPQFAAYAEALLMYTLYRDKYLKGFSVGFIDLKSEPLNPDDGDFYGVPMRFLKQELLENSVAPIPAHPDALAEIRGLVQRGNLYVPARYLRDDEGVQVEQIGEWLVAAVADEDAFSKLFVEEIDAGPIGKVVMSFGLLKGVGANKDSQEFILHSAMVKCCEVEEKDLVDWVSDKAKQALGMIEQDQKAENPPALKVFNHELYFPSDVVLVSGMPEIGEERFDDVDKEICGSRSLGTDDTATWDANAAVARMRKHAGGPNKDDMNWDTYKKGFVQRDAADKENFGSYKLPFADVVGGTLKATWGGVSNAMKAVLGSRGGVDIPETERKGAYNFLASYYKKFDKPVPDYKATDTDGDDFDLADVEEIPDGAILIDKEDVEKPYPNEHACRLESPNKYDKFARKNCYKKHDGKCIDYIFGIVGGKGEVQALRYPKESWDAKAARAHCSSKGGTFEAAGSVAELTIGELREAIGQEVSAALAGLYNGYHALTVLVERQGEKIDALLAAIKQNEGGGNVNDKLEQGPVIRIVEGDANGAETQTEGQDTEDQAVIVLPEGVTTNDVKELIVSAVRTAAGQLPD